METLHRQVIRRLGERICSGDMPPGSLLPSEPLLAQQYDVSRITIREAVKALTAKGMLVVRRKSGTLVLPRSEWQLFDPDVMRWRAATGAIDAALVADLLELRRLIEPAAARMAAIRATDADRIALRVAYDAMARAVESDVDNYVPADVAFHGVVLKACGNQFVQQMQNAMSAILQASFDIGMKVPGAAARSLPMHQDLCIAIEAKDPDAAAKAALTVLRQAELDLESHFGLLSAGSAETADTEAGAVS